MCAGARERADARDVGAPEPGKYDETPADQRGFLVIARNGIDTGSTFDMRARGNGRLLQSAALVVPSRTHDGATSHCSPPVSGDGDGSAGSSTGGSGSGSGPGVRSGVGSGVGSGGVVGVGDGVDGGELGGRGLDVAGGRGAGRDGEVTTGAGRVTGLVSDSPFVVPASVSASIVSDADGDGEGLGCVTEGEGDGLESNTASSSRSSCVDDNSLSLKSETPLTEAVVSVSWVA